MRRKIPDESARRDSGADAPVFNRYHDDAAAYYDNHGGHPERAASEKTGTFKTELAGDIANRRGTLDYREPGEDYLD